MTLLPGSNILASDFVFSVLAGENLTANDAVYISSSDGKAYKTDADDISKIGFVGFAISTITSGNSVYIRHFGMQTGFSSLTIGATYYLSGTAGALTATKPTNFKIVGTAVTSTILRIATEQTVRTRYYTSTSGDTWYKFNGLRYVEVVAIGGGGGGQGSSGTSEGRGGGAGGYSFKRIAVETLGTSETVTVGSGGAGDNTGYHDGTSGGTSSFGSHCSSTGGTRGYDGGAGGSGSSGDVNFSGEAGAPASGGSGGGQGGGAYSIGIGGAGGGGGSNGSSAPSNTGGGGGGAGEYNSTGRNGGAGGSGIVIVREYY